MEQVKATIQKIEGLIKAGEVPEELFRGEPLTTPGQGSVKSEPGCEFCRGCGFESIPSYCVVATRAVVTASRPCRCRIEAERRRALALIPAEFGVPRLDSIYPDASRHPLQAQKIEAIRERPDASYFIYGDNGTGKTFLGWALYVHAVEAGRKAVMVELDALLKAYRRYQFRHDSQGEVVDQFRPVVMASDLQNAMRKWTIFLDEIGATVPTEYAAKEFFYLLKAAHEHGHQMVYTCNVSPQVLQAHWSRADAFWGNSIARRIAEYSERVNLFR